MANAWCDGNGLLSSPEKPTECDNFQCPAPNWDHVLLKLPKANGPSVISLILIAEFSISSHFPPSMPIAALLSPGRVTHSFPFQVMWSFNVPAISIQPFCFFFIFIFIYPVIFRTRKWQFAYSTTSRIKLTLIYSQIRVVKRHYCWAIILKFPIFLLFVFRYYYYFISNSIWIFIICNKSIRFRFMICKYIFTFMKNVYFILHGFKMDSRVMWLVSVRAFHSLHCITVAAVHFVRFI